MDDLSAGAADDLWRLQVFGNKLVSALIDLRLREECTLPMDVGLPRSGSGFAVSY